MIDEEIVLDKNLTRVLDILEQVKNLKGMIELHENQSDDKFMVTQYQDLKNRFLEELKIILSDYDIEVLIKNAA